MLLKSLAMCLHRFILDLVISVNRMITLSQHRHTSNQLSWLHLKISSRLVLSPVQSHWVITELAQNTPWSSNHIDIIFVASQHKSEKYDIAVQQPKAMLQRLLVQALSLEAISLEVFAIVLKLYFDCIVFDNLWSASLSLNLMKCSHYKQPREKRQDLRDRLKTTTREDSGADLGEVYFIERDLYM